MIIRHKFLAGSLAVSAVFVLFIAVSIYRGYFMIAGSKVLSNVTQGGTDNSSHKKIVAKLPSISPSPSDNPSPSDSAVLGTSDNPVSGNTDAVTVSEVPSVAVSPVPTDTPEPTLAPVSYTSNDTSPADPNCTTGSGVPNSWYSDVYPNPPVSTSNGSMTLIVNIRDCSINDVSSSSTLKISLSSGDPNTRVNGHTLPYSLSTQNGQASFTVTSQVVGTVTLIIQDTTDSFTVTNINNSNPSITFSSAPVTPTPTQGATPTPTQQPSSPTITDVSPAPTN